MEVDYFKYLPFVPFSKFSFDYIPEKETDNYKDYEQARIVLKQSDSSISFLLGVIGRSSYSLPIDHGCDNPIIDVLILRQNEISTDLGGHILEIKKNKRHVFKIEEILEYTVINPKK